MYWSMRRHDGHRIPLLCGNELDGILRQTLCSRPPPGGPGDGKVRIQRFGAAAQDDRISRLDAEHGGIAGDVRTRFVDDANYADWSSHLRDSQTVWAGPLADRFARPDPPARRPAQCPWAMAAIRVSVRRSRSTAAVLKPCSAAPETSFSFASSSCGVRASSSSAMARRMALRRSVCQRGQGARRDTGIRSRSHEFAARESLVRVGRIRHPMRLCHGLAGQPATHDIDAADQSRLAPEAPLAAQNRRASR